MATIDITPDPLRTKNYFGSVHFESCVEEVSSIPEQILGIIPVELTGSSCFSICRTFKFIEGDKNRFLFRFPSDAFADNYKLEEYVSGSWSEVVTGNPSNFLGAESGTKYGIGFDTNYPTYGGFELDWQLIYDNFGSGMYRFVVDNVTPAEKLYSVNMQLFENTCDNIDRNVYIEFDSRGRYENFLYTKDNDRDQFHDLVNLSLAWFDAVRIDGRLIETSPEEESNFVKYGDFSNSIYRSEDRLVYELYAFELDQETLNRINLYAFKSHNIKITDYSSDSPRVYDKVNVVKDGAPDFKKVVNNRKLYQIKWTFKSEFDQGYRSC